MLKKLQSKTIAKLSLKQRITLLVGLLLALIAITLMSFGIFSSHQYFEATYFMDKITLNSAPEDAIRVVPIQPALPPAYSLPAATLEASIYEAQRGFSKSIVLITLAIIIAGSIVTYFVVGRALEPLTALSQTIATIGEHNLNERITVQPTRDEVASLTDSFNTMLSRLESSFEVQKRFSANVAHELKTPLATIKTSLQVLNLDETPTLTDYAENAQIIGNSVDGLIEIVNNLLLLAAPEQTISEKVVLQELVLDCLQILKPQVQAKALQVAVESKDCVVLGNRALLTSLVYNLLDNATKYNRQGGQLAVKLFGEADKVKLLVTDNGIGMTEEGLAHIFEPFYRVDPSRSKGIEGNGLGLSIVKSIVDSYGGTIQIRSRWGEGTQVLVELLGFFG